MLFLMASAFVLQCARLLMLIVGGGGTALLIRVLDTSRGSHGPPNWAQHIRSEIAKVLSGCADEEMSSSLALAIVDFAKTDFDRWEEGRQHENDCCSTKVSNSVPSEVDWSEFNTHHLREEVLAKIASLRQLYQPQNSAVDGT
ncbi:hypothetical protein GPALN_004973 [Globodera pallida]|nr:hypothetical protein GPALN_004973 [Globodera pallida]